MPGRIWTAEEDETVRKQYKRTPMKQLAAELRRSPGAVYQRANKLGLHDPRDFAELADRKEKIKQLIASGLSDSEAAERIGMGRSELSDMRRRMKVEANGRSERYRKRVAVNTRRQCQEAGVESLGAIRSKKYKEFAAEIGWPGVSVRAAQIADALYRLGPMTRKQICAAIGVQWRGARKSLGNCRVPGCSYMAELQRAGIVVRLENAISHKGKGNHEDVYMIGLGVEPCRKTR